MANAAFWLDALAAVLVVIWFAGAWFVARTRQAFAEPLRGEADAALAPAALLATFARALAQARPGSALGGSVVDTATGDEVRWTSAVAPRHTGRIRATGDARRARVAWEIECRSSLVGAALAVVVIGAAVTTALYLLLRTYALPSEQSGARWQVLQMIQAIHLLWPPFLLAGLARTLRRRIGAEVQRTVQNAAFAAGS